MPVPPPMPAVTNIICEPVKCSRIASIASSAAARPSSARAGAEALGHTSAHLDDALGLGLGERLCVGSGDDEIDALKACRDHVVNSVTAGAADPEHGNARLHLANIGDVAHVYFTIGHGWLPASLAVCFHYGRG